jgi:uncharacterized SAM-binding protein YcdF (DUF218 family)
MKAHGWRSAEVVSSAYHLPRAGLIFSRLPLEWRIARRAAALAGFGGLRDRRFGVEDLKTARYLIWTRQTERCEP